MSYKKFNGIVKVVKEGQYYGVGDGVGKFAWINTQLIINTHPKNPQQWQATIFLLNSDAKVNWKPEKDFEQWGHQYSQKTIGIPVPIPNEFLDVPQQPAFSKRPQQQSIATQPQPIITQPQPIATQQQTIDTKTPDEKLFDRNIGTLVTPNAGITDMVKSVFVGADEIQESRGTEEIIRLLNVIINEIVVIRKIIMAKGNTVSIPTPIPTDFPPSPPPPLQQPNINVITRQPSEPTDDLPEIDWG